MDEKVLKFHGGLFTIDQDTPEEFAFYIGFVGQRVLYRKSEIDLRYKGVITQVRKKRQSKYLEIPLVPEQDVHVSFDCNFSITKLAGNILRITLDDKIFFVKLKIAGVEVNGEYTKLRRPGDTFDFRRTSGESPRIATIKVAGEVLKIPFTKSVKMSFIPVVSSPSTARMLKDMRPPRATAEDRIEAWKFQSFGWIAIHKDGSEWEKVTLTTDEKAFIDEQNKQKRQKEFEENCLC